MKRKCYYLLLLVLMLTPALSKAETYRVANPDEFNRATASVKAGDEIVIVNGNYTGWQLELRTSGAPGKPVMIRAETTGKVIFGGEVKKPVFLLRANYITLKGLTFNGASQVKADGGSAVVVELNTTKNCRVTECAFTGITARSQNLAILVVSGKGEDNRIDHCRFSANVDNQEVQVRISAQEIPQRTLIDHNDFRDKPKVSWKNSNGGECIQVGQDPILLGTQYSYTIVRENTFTACDGEPEVISNKSSGNQYIKNRFENCQGELVMRGGHDSKIDSNYFNGGRGGIRVSGTNHVITNNIMKGLPTGIRLMYGMSKGKTETGFYVAASDCVIKNNTIIDCKTGILIGDGKNADWTGKFDTARYPSRTMQDVAPFNNTLAANRISGAETPVKHNEN